MAKTKKVEKPDPISDDPAVTSEQFVAMVAAKLEDMKMTVDVKRTEKEYQRTATELTIDDVSVWVFYKRGEATGWVTPKNGEAAYTIRTSRFHVEISRVKTINVPTRQQRVPVCRGTRDVSEAVNQTALQLVADLSTVATSQSKADRIAATNANTDEFNSAYRTHNRESFKQRTHTHQLTSTRFDGETLVPPTLMLSPPVRVFIHPPASNGTEAGVRLAKLIDLLTAHFDRELAKSLKDHGFNVVESKSEGEE